SPRSRDGTARSSLGAPCRSRPSPRSPARTARHPRLTPERARVPAPGSGSLPRLDLVLDESRGGVVASLGGLLAALVRPDEDREVLLRSEPGDDEPHRVAPAVRQRLAARPVALADGPAHGVLRVGSLGRRVELREG